MKSMQNVDRIYRRQPTAQRLPWLALQPPAYLPRHPANQRVRHPVRPLQRLTPMVFVRAFVVLAQDVILVFKEMLKFQAATD